MKPSHHISCLGLREGEVDVEQLLESLTFNRPGLDSDDANQHYDWVLAARKGVELGFVDRAYFNAESKFHWRTDGLILNQITYYCVNRDGVSAYKDELPHGLCSSDTREVVRDKLAAYESTRHSYITDRWNVDNYRLIIGYLPDSRGIDNILIKLPISPWPEKGRLQPSLNAEDWIALFGESAGSDYLIKQLLPLDLSNQLNTEGGREIDFLDECGVELYFESANQLQLKRQRDHKDLVFGAVKFHRARDLEGRQYTGELPFAVNLDDSPEILFQKIPFQPTKKDDGKLTGHALWHLSDFSFQVLYSTVENHLFRVTVMAPGYWQEMFA